MNGYLFMERLKFYLFSIVFQISSHQLVTAFYSCLITFMVPATGEDALGVYSLVLVRTDAYLGLYSYFVFMIGAINESKICSMKA
jgi:hypothetical protein